MGLNANARAASRNPMPSKVPASPAPHEIPADALERAAHAATRPAPSNDASHEPGAFARTLSTSGVYLGANGQSWAGGPLSYSDASTMAGLDRCLAGLGGVLEVLHASVLGDGERIASGEDSFALNSRLLDRLHCAAAALMERAEESVERLRDRLGGNE